MKQWIALKKWWQHLAKREQFILSIGGLIALLFVCYQFIYLPYDNKIKNSEQDITNQQKLLAWMKDAELKIQTLKTGVSQAQSLGQKSLLTVVADSLKDISLVPNNIGQAANEKVTVKFDNVNFDQLIQWLIVIWQSYGVQISQLTIEAKTEPGAIEANLVLEIKK